MTEDERQRTLEGHIAAVEKTLAQGIRELEAQVALLDALYAALGGDNRELEKLGITGAPSG